ncbi:4122_t:CDS:2 [Cetraspora pellucida]|uniref:4122_t:CDS:1 n=1 Tax=Cetraspora pellucida TaxID=1433469 RepID=A0A9N9I9G3_9GLOM|nr:4122_t:CDS:2 [Cetraspora pellucida]
MSSTTNNNTRYRYGCTGPGCNILNSFIENLFRKIAPNKAKVKPVRNEPLENGSLPSQWNCSVDIYNLERKVDSLSEFKDEDFTSELFNEVIIFTPAQKVSGRSTTLRTHGMTRDPKSKAYMMVMTLADYGDLSTYLKKEFSKVTYIHKLEILYDIATGICQIHESGLVHRDLHSRNVLFQGIKNRSMGRGENHRFVIGKRPEIVPNTPKLYADLMQRCWCDNKEKRPSAFELYMTIGTWLNQCLFVPDSEITKRFKKGDEHSLKIPQSQSLHPENVLYSTYHKTLPLNPVNPTVDPYNSISDYDDDYLFMTITDAI